MTRQVSRKIQILFRISGIALSLIIALIVGEVALRMLGFRPWIDQRGGIEPLLLEYQPTYGWQSKEGTYTYSILPGGPPVHVTVLPDGIRSSGTTQGPDSGNKPNIVVVGCSWMFGWALSDEQTLAWKLQEAFPDWHVVNYGTAAYGTYQSLLRLEEAVPRLHPDVILYGFIQTHEIRNVASGFWLNRLAENSQRGRVSLPYVTFSQGRLERHGLTRYSSWPGRKHSALITLLERSWADISTSKRTRHAHQATLQLMLDMKRLADRNHAKLLVVFLGGPRFDSDSHASDCAFAEANGIPYVDCSQSAMDESTRVPGDGHPNAQANAQWFDSIEPVMRQLLTQKPESKP
jgi:hypothetical protein